MTAPGIFPKVSSNVIYVQDYNTIQSIVFNVKTNFYGAACVSSQLTSVLIDNDHWNNLKTDIDYCIAIQGIPLSTSLTTKINNQIINASDINLYKVAADQINANKRGLFTVSANAGAVNEGIAVTFTVTTLYVPSGTVLFWYTLGSAVAGDFTDGTTSGTVTISGSNPGSGSIIRTLLADSVTEGAENFTMYIYDGIELVATSTSVVVNDTSQDPPTPDGGADFGGDTGCTDSSCTDSSCTDAACGDSPGDSACVG